jgi:hypothetical protein
MIWVDEYLVLKRGEWVTIVFEVEPSATEVIRYRPVDDDVVFEFASQEGRKDFVDRYCGELS